MLNPLAAFAFAADGPKWEPLKALGYEWDVPSAAEWRAEPNLLEMLKILPRHARAATARIVCPRTDQALPQSDPRKWGHPEGATG